MVVLESNLIIGNHIKLILHQNGYDIYNNIIAIDYKHITIENKPDIIIINHKRLLKYLDEILKEFQKSKNLRLIILACLTIDPTIKQKLKPIKYTCIEKPFISKELVDALL